MKTRQHLANLVIGLLVILSIAGCSKMVAIQSEPAGADVYINNRKIGKTPINTTLDDFAFTDYMITLKKEGIRIIAANCRRKPWWGP